MNRTVVDDIALRLLTDTSNGVSFKAKYFFVRLLFEYGIEEQINASVKELMAVLRISSADIKSARDTLIKSKAVKEIKVSGERGGAPRKCLKVQADWLHRNLCAAGYTSLNESLKDRVLGLFKPFGKNGLDRQQRASDSKQQAGDDSSLRASNRVLLAILLMHSDEFGVVTGLRMAKIRRMTGMSGDKLKSQIRTLIRRGYIQHYIPGGTSSVIFGKYTSVYFLDLEHNGFSLAKRQQTNLLVDRSFLNESNEQLDANKLNTLWRIESSRRKNKHQHNTDSSPYLSIPSGFGLLEQFTFLIPKADWKALRVFAEPSVATYLQFHIDHYTSQLLSHHHQAISRFKQKQWVTEDAELGDDLKHFVETIHQEIMPNNVKARKVKSEDDNVEPLYRTATTILFNLARLRASSILKTLKAFLTEQTSNKAKFFYFQTKNYGLVNESLRIYLSAPSPTVPDYVILRVEVPQQKTDGIKPNYSWGRADEWNGIKEYHPEIWDEFEARYPEIWKVPEHKRALLMGEATTIADTLERQNKIDSELSSKIKKQRPTHWHRHPVQVYCLYADNDQNDPNLISFLSRYGLRTIID